MQEEEAPAGRQGAERDLGGSAAGAQEPNDAPDSRAWDPWGTSPPPGGTAEQASSSGEVVEDASAANPWSTWASEVADEPSATDWWNPFEVSPTVSEPTDKIVDPVSTQVEPLEPEVATPPLNLADQIDPNWPVLEELNSRELMEVQDVLGDPSRLSDPQVFEDLNPHQIQAVMQALAGHVSTPETGIVGDPEGGGEEQAGTETQDNQLLDWDPDDPLGLDRDGDGIEDYKVVDSDGDGIVDVKEDSDGDGIVDVEDVDVGNDGIEDWTVLDSDGDGVYDPQDSDGDGDGIEEWHDLNGDGMMDWDVNDNGIADSDEPLDSPLGAEDDWIIMD